MKCKHENVFVQRAWRVHFAGEPKSRLVDARVCLGGIDGKPCGAMLSLGKANDTDERVEIEIAAARAAADYSASSLLDAVDFKMPGDHREDCDVCEVFALAAIIATHSTTHSTAEPQT